MFDNPKNNIAATCRLYGIGFDAKVLLYRRAGCSIFTKAKQAGPQSGY
jgi:hypothetical protein